MAKMVTPEMVKINKRLARENRGRQGKPSSPGREAWLRLKRNHPIRNNGLHWERGR